jgi:hypothetical protein
MRPCSRPAPTVLLLLALAATGCGDRQRARDLAAMDFAVRDTTVVLGPGDITIVTVDSTIQLSLIDDYLATGLSAHSLAQVRRDTDPAAVTGDGLGARLERMIKRSVASTLGREIRVPLESVAEIRYDDGRLRFLRPDGGELSLFENSKSNGRPIAEAFRPEDAREFAARFQARKAERQSKRQPPQ